MLSAHTYHAPSPRSRVLARHIAELLLLLVNKTFGVTFAVSGCPFLITGLVAAVHRIYVSNEEKASIVADFSPNFHTRRQRRSLAYSCSVRTLRLKAK